MAYDQHALAAMLTGDGVDDVAGPQDHVAPALPAGGPVVELADPGPELCLLGVALLDAELGEAVEHAELPLAEALVDHQVHVV